MAKHKPEKPKLVIVNENNRYGTEAINKAIQSFKDFSKALANAAKALNKK